MTRYERGFIKRASDLGYDGEALLKQAAIPLGILGKLLRPVGWVGKTTLKTLPWSMPLAATMAGAYEYGRSKNRRDAMDAEYNKWYNMYPGPQYNIPQDSRYNMPQNPRYIG